MAAAFYQVLVGLKPTFQIEYPDNFKTLMKAFNWIDLDWDTLAYPEGEFSLANLLIRWRMSRLLARQREEALTRGWCSLAHIQAAFPVGTRLDC